MTIERRSAPIMTLSLASSKSAMVTMRRFLRAAIRAADFKSVRGDFRFGPNQFPVQSYYLQLVGKGADGRLAHKTIGTVLQNRADAYAQDCKMR